MESRSETVARVLDDFEYLITLGNIGPTVATDIKRRLEDAHRREFAELRECLKMAVVNTRIARTCCAFGRECDSCGQACDARKWNKVIEATKGAEDEDK